MRHEPRRFAGLLLLVALAAAACSGSSASPSPSGNLTVSGAWVRPPVGSDRPAAGYLVITNGTGQAAALLSAMSPAAGMVEVHETTRDSGGMMGMQQVPRIDIAAGATVRLEPGGYHLMLMSLKAPLTVGDKVTLQLTFERAGRIDVEAEVREG